MKILFVLPRFHTNQYFIIKTLIDYGHNVAMFVRFKGRASEKRDILEPELISHSSIFLFFKKYIFLKKENNVKFDIKYGFPFLISYFKKIKKEKPDIIIVRNPNDVFGFISLCIARILKVKKIIIYTLGPLYKKKDFKTILSKFFLILFKANWITPVEGDKTRYKKFNKRAYYLPFPIESTIKLFKDKQFFCGGNINIISIGKLNQKRKNLILLLEAVNILRKDFSNIRITLIGSLENEKGEHYLKTLKFIEENNLSDIVTIKKNIDLFGVYEEYKRNDLFILPSSNEPLGFALLEAMAFGLPLVCSDSVGAKWHIINNLNGYIFKSDDLNDLIEKICLIISDKNKLLKMAEESYKLSIKNHSPEVFYKKFMEIITI